MKVKYISMISGSHRSWHAALIKAAKPLAKREAAPAQRGLVASNLTKSEMND